MAQRIADVGPAMQAGVREGLDGLLDLPCLVDRLEVIADVGPAVTVGAYLDTA